MLIKLNVRGNLKQLEACRYWLDDETEEIYYGGAKGCHAANTPIATERGIRPIQDIKAGDRVFSYDVRAKKTHLKKVIETFIYGGDTQSKMIIFTLYGGYKIRCTDNHRFLIEGYWYPASRIAERAMALREGNKQSVSHIEQWTAIDYQMEKCSDHSHNEAGIIFAKRKSKGVFTYDNYSKREKQERKGSSTCCNGIYSKPRKQTRGKSQRLGSIKQRVIKFGVVYEMREYATCIRQRSNNRRLHVGMQTEKPMQGIKSVECETYRGSGKGNKGEIQTKSLYQRNVSQRIRSCSKYYKGLYSKELVTREINIHEIESIEFFESNELVYDLCVQDNHNYILGNGIITHNSGKSFLGVSLIFGDAFIYPSTHYFIARKELQDLRKHTIPSIYEVFKLWGITDKDFKYNGQDNYFQLANGSRVYLLSCTYLPSDPLFERFGSIQMTRGWIEEAGEVSEEAKKALWLTVGRWMNIVYNLKKKMLCTMNPKKNWIYRDVYKPFIAGTLKAAIKMILAVVHDNKSVSDDYKRSLEELTGIMRQRLYLGNWEYDDSDNALITYDAILDSFNNSHVLPDRNRYITADIALEGSDSFTITVWDGWVAIHFERIAKIKPQELIAKIEKLKNQYHVPNSHIVYDADGLGTYVGGWVIGAKAFHNGGTPIKVQGKPENYKNLKTQCYYYFAQKCMSHVVYLQALAKITDPVTGKSIQELCIEEMEQIKSALGDKEGKLQIIPKDEVKANIGRSPDITDCLMMRSLFDIIPKPQSISRAN